MVNISAKLTYIHITNRIKPTFRCGNQTSQLNASRDQQKNFQRTNFFQNIRTRYRITGRWLVTICMPSMWRHDTPRDKSTWRAFWHVNKCILLYNMILWKLIALWKYILNLVNLFEKDNSLSFPLESMICQQARAVPFSRLWKSILAPKRIHIVIKGNYRVFKVSGK